MSRLDLRHPRTLSSLFFQAGAVPCLCCCVDPSGGCAFIGSGCVSLGRGPGFLYTGTGMDQTGV